MFANEPVSLNENLVLVQNGEPSIKIGTHPAKYSVVPVIRVNVKYN